MKDETREPCDPHAPPSGVKETNPKPPLRPHRVPIVAVRQPWAWLIIHGSKDIENRRWKFDYRGPLLIHACLKLDKQACLDLRVPVPWDQLPVGGIVGYVQVVDCVQNSTSQWFEGPWGWQLADPKPVEFYPMIGKQGIFYDAGASKLID